MAVQDEDLDFNLFYQQLQSLFRSSFDDAINKCHVICVPQNASLPEHVNIDMDFVDTHILRPSPFFKGEFLTCHRNKAKTVFIKENVLQTGEGFPSPRFIKIIGEENGYNKDMKPFRLLIIERPLGASTSQITQSSVSQPSHPPLVTDPVTSLQECKKLLESLQQCRECMSKLESEMSQFCNNYLLLKGFVDDARKKLHDLYLTSSQNFSSCLHNHDTRVLTNVNQAIESYIISGVHNKLYPVIQAEHSQSDGRLAAKCHRLRHNMYDKLAVPPHLHCHLTSAVIEFEHLAIYKTPLEKRVCLKTCLDNIVSCVEAKFSQEEEEDVPVMTSDELIPLMSAVIVQSSRCSDLCSQMYVITQFSWSLPSADQYSFSMTTFQAAVEYLKTIKEEPSNIKTSAPDRMKSSPSSSPQVSHVSSHEVSQPAKAASSSSHHTAAAMSTFPQPSVFAASPSSSFSTQRQQRTDKPFSETLVFLPQNERSTIKPAKKQLGSFLSALKDDPLPCSYGKQN